MRNFLLDKFMLKERLLQRPTRRHTHYLRGRRALPLRLPSTAEFSRDDNKFKTLNTLEPATPNQKRPPQPLWMSPYSIRSIDKRAALSHNPCHNRNIARGLLRPVCRSLVADYRRQAVE